MGLFGKRMKDPVRGTAHVTGSSLPPHATHGNCRMTLVVQAEGMEPYSVEHHSLVTPVSKWPHAGTTLPVTVDRANPEKVKIEWDEVTSGDEDAAARAEAMVQRLQSGGASEVPPEAAGVVGQLQQMFPGATVQVQSGNQPATPEQIAEVERMMGIDLDGDGRVGGQGGGVTPSAVAAAPAPAGGPEDRIAQLERLAQLHESGALSDAEFEVEKRRVLGS